MVIRFISIFVENINIMKNMKKIIGVILLTIYIYACSSDNVEQNVPIGPTPDVITVTRISLPSSYLNPNTYRWDLINATYVSATQSTIYSISQSIDFNFFNTNKAKSKTLKAGGVTFINPTWDKFYTVTSVNLVKKVNQTQNLDVTEAPTYNKAGYPMIEFYLKEDSNGNIHYYTLGSDNKLKTQ